MDKGLQNTEQITTLLHEWKDGNKEAFDELFPLVYSELRRRASAYLRNERKGHTLQTTALVNEAYLNLVDKKGLSLADRNHFFAVSAQAMRRILVDYARKRKRKKRGGNDEELEIDETRLLPRSEVSTDLVALDEALGRLFEMDPRQAKVVELKYFGGMTNDETAGVLDISNVTVRREWDMAKAWLYEQLTS